jgi:hypothetical protein
MSLSNDLNYILYKSDLKYFLIGIVIAAALFIGWTQYNNMTGFAVQSDAGRVDITIDNGKVSDWYSVSFTAGRTAFDALKDVAYVDYKIYEDGVSLVGINNVTNSVEGSWSWTVNGGQPAEKLDIYKLKDGDSIVFKYSSPSANV